MKKIIISMFVLSLIALCFSGNINAQSSEQDLDQVELTKKFIGSWSIEIGQDTTMLWEVIPWGKGYEQNNHYKAKGETYFSTKGLLGFQVGYQNVVFCHMLPSGGIMRDVSKFVSDTKMEGDRYASGNPNHVSSKYEINFIAPDKFKMIHKYRGDKESWDDAVVSEMIATKVQ